MLKSIQETKKLFTVEGIADGQVDIKTSRYLLSLPEEKQIRVLSEQLIKLKNDMAGYEGGRQNSDEIYRTQLQLLIQVIEGLLNQV